MKHTKAFTLIELLIVIVIIGILAVALIPRLTGAQAAARDAARQASVQQIANGVNMMMSEAPNTAITTGALVSNGYLSSYPSDPRGSTYGSYTINGSFGSGYAICATVERTVKGNSSTCPTNPAAWTASNS